jgi:chemotaxis signal transduction protein
MKNAVVFALGTRRFAIELRWVREIVALGHITPVPRAPASVFGVVNVHGAIVPLIDLAPLMDEEHLATPHPGEAAVLVEAESATAAIFVGNVDEVSTLRQRDDGEWVDSTEEPVEILVAPELLETVISEAQRLRKRGLSAIVEAPD